jgi:hypothetical protein
MKNEDTDKLLGEYMSPDRLGLTDPDPLLVFEARMAVAARKKEKRVAGIILPRFIYSFFSDLKLHHLGICALFFMMGIFYINLSRDYQGNSTFDYRAEALSARSQTVSVVSATILTSIPTLRN